MERQRIVLIEEALTRSAIGAFYDVHRKLGFGFLEPIYARALEKELRKRGRRVRRELAVPVLYDGEQIGWHRLDMVVDDRLVVEIKSVEPLPPVARRQLLSHLCSTNFEIGLLLHFGYRPRFYRQIYSHGHRVQVNTRTAAEGADDAEDAENNGESF
jgi:GxxExxY protein